MINAFIGLEKQRMPRNLRLALLFLPIEFTRPKSRRSRELIKSPLKSSLIKNSSNTGHELLNMKVFMRR